MGMKSARKIFTSRMNFQKGSFATEKATVFLTGKVGKVHRELFYPIHAKDHTAF